jgi:4-diphosphocytidyl-2-C-methyl-D-erythritol kinase
MSLTLPSYAKINWLLEVIARRPDGYHEIRTVLQTIDLADTLHFQESDSGLEVACNHPSLPSGDANIVCRAASLLRELKGVRRGVTITIEKRIPVAAGLGGGSSNAAVALMGLARLWELELTAEELFQIGGELGSDVPFFFYGGTALGVGRGAEVYPLADVAARHLLLVNPGVEVSTRSVYGQLTKKEVISNIPVSCAAVFRASRGGRSTGAQSSFVEEGRNDLEEVILSQVPEVGRVFRAMSETGAQAVGMSGSGPTVFAVFDSEDDAAGAEAQMSHEPWLRFCSRTVSRDEYWKHLSVVRRPLSVAGKPTDDGQRTTD